MTKQIVRKDNTVRPGLVRTADVSNLLRKIEEDLWKKDTEKARVKLEAVGQIYDNLTGCAFYGMMAFNYEQYLGLKQAYKKQVGDNK